MFLVARYLCLNFYDKLITTLKVITEFDLRFLITIFLFRRVFTILPNLKLLDGLPNLPSDLVQDEDEDTKAGTCCIC